MARMVVERAAPSERKLLLEASFSPQSPRKLHGRDDEVWTLQRRYQSSRSNVLSDRKGPEVASSQRRQEVVLISGSAGSGKTTLGRTLQGQVQRDGGFFLTGKFDSKQQSYSAFVNALTDAFYLLMEKPGRIEMIHEKMKGDNCVPLLIELVPTLAPILLGSNYPQGRKRNHAQMTQHHHQQHQHQQEQHPQHQYQQPRQNCCSAVGLHTSIAKFFRVLACPELPVVLFLDDVHHADAASLELIRVLCTTVDGARRSSGSSAGSIGLSRRMEPPTSSGLTVVCSYETKEHENRNEYEQQQSQNHHQSSTPLGVFLQDLKDEPTVALTEIRLENYASAQINQMVTEMLNFRTEEAETAIALTALVMKQTNGNINDVLTFLRFLTEQKIIQEDRDGYYVLKCKDLQQDANNFDGKILNFIADRIRISLSDPSQRVLKIAACMGKVIDDSSISLLVNTTSVIDTLAEAEKEGLLKFDNERQVYSFADERVRKAAFSLIPRDSVANFLLRLGRRLWQTKSHATEGDSSYVVANLMYAGMINSTVPQKERVQVVELHAKSGQHAILHGSFAEANLFFRRGLELLMSETHWQNYHALTLTLYNGLIRCSLWSADFKRVKELVSDIMKYSSSAPVESKIIAYRALVQLMSQTDRLNSVQAFGWKVLNKLGQQLQKAMPTPAVVAELARTKLSIRGKNATQFVRLRRITDARRIAALEFLDYLIPVMFLQFSPALISHALRLVRLSLNQGFHSVSCLGLALYAMLSASEIGRLNEGHRFVEVSLSLVKAEENKKELPAVYAIVFSTLHHLHSPIRESLDPLRFAARTALEVGNVGYFALNRVTFCNHAFYAGFPLDYVRQDILRYRSLFYRHRQENFWEVFYPMLQFIQNTTIGVSGDFCVLSGDCMTLSDSVQEWKRQDNAAALMHGYLMAALLAYIYNDFELAHEMIAEFEALRKIKSTLYASMFADFLGGLICCELIRLLPRDGPSRHVKAQVQGYLKRVTQWAKSNPASFLHKQRLLEAELASWQSREEEARKLYADAIERARAEGFVQEAAIACERASDHMRREGNTVMHSLYRKKARSHYLQWGASAKAMRLRSSITEALEKASAA